MSPKDERDIKVSLDNLVDLLEDVLIKATSMAGSEWVEAYVKDKMSAVYRNLRRA